MITTTYEEWEQVLFALPSSQGLEPHLHRAEALDSALGYPTRNYPTVHVAGSNGKGSVALKIAHALQASGYRVGLYTSPHLFSYRERIVVNQEPISEDAVCAGLEKLFALKESLNLPLTCFELTTFLAFHYFREQQVDIAIIETGIGGRFDCTNVITPILSVITSISKEHVGILGNDLEAIAYQKAGIIKPRVPVVVGPKARCHAIYVQAHTFDCPVFVSKKISHFFDEENGATARLALEKLSSSFPVSKEALEQGLSVRPPCRFERCQQVIFDVAHNSEGIFALLQALHLFFPEAPLRFVVGFCRDKDYTAALAHIAHVATHIHLVHADSPRALASEELQRALSQDSPELSTAHCSIEEGILAAYDAACSGNELVVVCGTFYIMARAKRCFEELLIQTQ